MSGAYALVDDCNTTVYTLGDIAKVTEECFFNCYGTNFMYLPPQNVKARKAWAGYEDEEEEAPRIPIEDLNSPEEGLWTEVVHKSRSNASTGTSSTASSFTGMIVSWYGKPVGVNKDGSSYSKKPYGWIETENDIDGNNRFIFFWMPPGAKYGRFNGTKVEFDVEYNDTPIGRCANISHLYTYIFITVLTDRTDLTEIPSGFKSLPGKDTCDSCAPGYFRASPGGIQYDACDAGMVQPAQGSSSCVRCKAGAHQSLPGKVVCDVCAPATSAHPGGAVAVTGVGLASISRCRAKSRATSALQATSAHPRVGEIAPHAPWAKSNRRKEATAVTIARPVGISTCSVKSRASLVRLD
eukprot:6201395-Prymnesium_polylepis.1